MTNTKKISSDRNAWWVIGGTALGLIIGLGIIVPFSCNSYREQNRKQDLMREVKENPLYHSSITVVKRDYIVSDLDGNGEEDTIYTLFCDVLEGPWNMYHEEHVYTKGDSDFERVLNEAKSARVHRGDE